jgi:hypothetical protein
MGKGMGSAVRVNRYEVDANRNEGQLLPTRLAAAYLLNSGNNSGVAPAFVQTKAATSTAR